MHRIKTIYESKTSTKTRHIPKEPRDPFSIRQNRYPNPERLSDNGTLDTFLHRIRIVMLNPDMHKQKLINKDNLTRKERIALRELTQNPHIVIKKADQGSTIVVKDRDDYISNAMSHLNDNTVYKPLTRRHNTKTKRQCLK